MLEVRDLQGAYGPAPALWGGSLATNLFWRRDPGNRADLPADRGAALRFSVGY